MIRRHEIRGAVLCALLLSGCGSTVATTGAQGGGSATQFGPAASGQGPAGAGDGLTGGAGGSTSPTANGGVLTPAGTGDGGTPAQTSGSSGGGIRQSTTGAAAPAQRPAPTGELKFGLLTVKDAGAAVGAIGGNNNNTGSEASWANAMISYINAHGGVAGRKLKPIEYQIDPQSTNYETELAAACARFTQDNKVSLVVSQSGYLWSASFQTCLTQAGVGNLLSAGAFGDAAQLKQHPALYNVYAPTPERRTRALLNGLHSSGFLTSKNTIGVLVEDCAESARTFSSTFAPLAAKLGLKVERRNVGCLRGFGDVGAFQAQVQASVLPFRTAGVDRVVYLTPWEGLMMLFFENQAQSQSYAPLYGLTSNSIPALNPGNYSPGQLARMRGMGWSPVSDTTQGPPRQRLATCEAAGKSAGLGVRTLTDRTYMAQSCEHLFVMKAALEAAGGRDDPASLTSGLVAASKSYKSVLQVSGRISLGGQHKDSPTQVAEFGYLKSCSCFKYLSAPRALD